MSLLRATSVSHSDNDLGDETVTYLYHNERWKLTNTFHGSGADPYERNIHHAAGLYGKGGSSYIDSVVLIDRDAGLDGTFETRLYPIQNWRSDIVGMVTDTGKQRGQTRYEAYGTPFGYMAGDVNNDGFWDNGDINFLLSEIAVPNYHIRYDEDLDGTADLADIVAFNTLSHIGNGRHKPALENTPFGYAGYELDPDLAQSKMHVRNRVYLSDTGRWSRRDPIGYVDGPSMFEYARSMPVVEADGSGLGCKICMHKRIVNSTTATDGTGRIICQYQLAELGLEQERKTTSHGTIDCSRIPYPLVQTRYEMYPKGSQCPLPSNCNESCFDF